MTKYTNPGAEGNHQFEKFREAWGLQIATDHELRAIDLRVTIVLQSYLNRKTFAAFPSVSTLTTRVGRSESAVRKSLKTLVKRGHLRIPHRVAI